MFVEPPEVIRITDLSKRFVVRKDNSLKERLVGFGRSRRSRREEFWALKDLSVAIRAGESVGLIGHNGSGKSTLLKLIGGILDPSGGKVEHRGRIAALLELGAGFHPDLTGRENVFLNASLLGLTLEETESRFAAILEFSGIGDFIDTQVKFYSSGMFVRLAFAVAVHTDPDILLVDEVLAVGDEAFQKKCMDKIDEFRSQGVTIIFVSHLLRQVASLCDRVLVLDHGSVVFDGDPSTGIAELRQRLEEDGDEGAHPDSPEADLPQPAKVASTEFEIVGRAPGETMQPGDTLEVRVTLEHDGPIEEWDCGVTIMTAQGVWAYATHLSRLGVERPGFAGRRTCSFRIVEPPLAGGEYVIATTFIGPSRTTLSVDAEAAWFKVAPDPETYGIMRARATARIDS